MEHPFPAELALVETFHACCTAFRCCPCASQFSSHSQAGSAHCMSGRLPPLHHAAHQLRIAAQSDTRAALLWTLLPCASFCCSTSGMHAVGEPLRSGRCLRPQIWRQRRKVVTLHPGWLLFLGTLYPREFSNGAFDGARKPSCTIQLIVTRVQAYVRQMPRFRSCTQAYMHGVTSAKSFTPGRDNTMVQPVSDSVKHAYPERMSAGSLQQSQLLPTVSRQAAL